MSMEKRRDELGKLLVCLLVSRKGVSTIRDLERDYRENEGQNIPYKEFGYLSSLDFFRSISNHVKLVPGTGTYLVYPVVSDKIKHVNELVLRQRPAKRGTSIRRRPSRYSHCFPSVRDPKPFVPNTVQKQIAKILTSSPSGVDKSYIAQCLDQSEEVPGTVDSNNVDEYLTGMPYTAVGKGSRVYPSRALSATPNIPARRRTEDIDGFEMVSPGDSKTQNEPSPRNDNTRVVHEYPAGEEDGGDYYVEDDYDEPQFSNVNNNYAADKEYQSQQSLKIDGDNRPRMSSAEFIHRAGTQYNQSQYDEFQKECNNNVVKNDENGVEVEGHDEAETNGLNNEDCTFESDDDGSIDIINSRLKERLQRLIQKHPDGIWCANLLQSYLDEYGFTLDYAELGFSSVSQLAANLPKIFRLHRQSPRGDFLLFDATKPLPPSAQKPESCASSNVWEGEYCDDDVDPFPMKMPLETAQSLIPRDVLTQGETVGQERIPEVNAGEECLEIFVVEVFTPSLFWIHLRKKRSKLCQLMEDMNKFYEQEGDNYSIPPIILEKGLNCVCTFENKWHRAIIKTVKPDGNVTLIFYDYGTIKTYPPDDLRFLVRKYSNLPAQAIACGLYNVKPIKADAWTRGASDEFYTKVADLPMVAIVVKVDRENNSMLISLVDTRNETDVHINDWLVASKLAETGFMVRSRPSNFVYRHYLACTNHYCNTFVRNPRPAKRDKVKLQVSSKALDHFQSEPASGSKITLKSANFAKNFMARHSRYKKESGDSASSNTKTKIPNRQANLAAVAHARVKGCSSTDSTALKVADPPFVSIEYDGFSKLFRYKLNSENQKSNSDKNDEKVAEAQFLDTCKQSNDVKQNDNSNSTASQSGENRAPVRDDSRLDKTSETRVQEAAKFDNTEELQFSGTFRSFYGGHGEMEPIDWSQVRIDMQGGQQTKDPKLRAKSKAIVESPLWKLCDKDTEKSEAHQCAERCSDDLSKESSTRKMVSDIQKVTVVESVVKKKEEKKTLPAKDCFLNAVQSNKDHYYSSYGEKLWWSPEGNIQENAGAITPLLRKQIKNITEIDTDSIKVSVPPKISEMLREKKLWYKRNKGKSTVPNEVLDPEVHFITQLENLADFVSPRISDQSRNENVKTLIPLEDHTRQSKLSSEITVTRISTILDYINKKKQQNVTSNPAESFSTKEPDVARDTNNIETVASTSSCSNLSSSSNSSRQKLTLGKEFRERVLHLRASHKNEVILGSQKPAEIYSSVENTDSKRGSMSSENLSKALKSEASETEVPELDRLPKEPYPALSKNQNKILTVNTSPENISTEIQSGSAADYNRAEIEEYVVPEASKESPRSPEKIGNHSNFSENSDTAFELDSDDLSRSYSNSESDVKISISKTSFDLIENIGSNTVVDENAAAISVASLEDYEDISQLCEGDDESLDSNDEKQIEKYVPQIKSEIFAPVVNDLDSMSDSDEWEVNGEWTDFMKDGQYTNRIVRTLELEHNTSQSAEIVEITDNSELGHAFNKDYTEHQHRAESGTEEICQEKYKSHDTSDSDNRESIGSLEPFEFVSKEKLENSSDESDRTDCLGMQIEARNMNGEIKSALPQRSETVIDKTNEVGNETEISMQNNDKDTGLATDSQNTLRTRVINSKTKSMHEMLNNLKSKRNLGKLSRDSKNLDNSSQSEPNTFVSFEQKTDEHVESEIGTSPKDVKSGEIYAKESFANSEMLTDSDDTSSSRDSIICISNDMGRSENDTESMRCEKNDKKYGSLLEHCKISNEESPTSSSDAIEFIEEQPKKPCAPLSILSKIKAQQLSVKSSVQDIGVPNTSRLDISSNSERDSSVLNESTDSNSSLSRSFLDRIRSIYSNKN